VFIAAAKALAELSPARLDPRKNLFPPVDSLRQVAVEVAKSVAAQAIREGLVDNVKEREVADKVNAKIWYPTYARYQRVRELKA
jgi:malate dehydrogenase (oxaloacetate-decarboxylating)